MKEEYKKNIKAKIESLIIYRDDLKSHLKDTQKRIMLLKKMMGGLK